MTALALSAGQRSMGCSSVDAIWAAAADRNHIFSIQSPDRLTYPPEATYPPISVSESDHQAPASILRAAVIISALRWIRTKYEN